MATQDELFRQLQRERTFATPEQIVAQESPGLRRRGVARSVHPITDITGPIRRFVDAPVSQTGPVGLAADLLLGGTARYADKLARGERMNTFDYVAPALELPGGIAGAGVRAVDRGIDFARGLRGAARPERLARARAVEAAPDIGRRQAVGRIGGATAAGLGLAAAGRLGRQVVPNPKPRVRVRAKPVRTAEMAQAERDRILDSAEEFDDFLFGSGRFDPFDQKAIDEASDVFWQGKGFKDKQHAKQTFMSLHEEAMKLSGAGNKEIAASLEEVAGYF